jgi:hypothetical protein
MSHANFANPITDRHARACRYCRWYGGLVDGTSSVWCLRDKLVCAAGMGCVHFEREPGADDDVPADRSGFAATIPDVAT